MHSYGRQVNWDYYHSMTAHFGETLCGYAYDGNLAGSNGMHFHFWVPRHFTAEDVKEIARCASGKRDVVSYSWDFIPDVKSNNCGADAGDKF